MLFADLHNISVDNATVAGFLAQRSLLLNDGDSPYMTLTPSVAGDDNQWVVELWFKPASNAAASDNYIFYVDNGSAETWFRFDDQRLHFRVRDSGAVVRTQLLSTAVFRDYSAFYHIRLVYDDTVASPGASNIFIEVNGEKIADFTTETYPPQNQGTLWNTAVQHEIFASPSGAQSLDGYVANFITYEGADQGSTVTFNDDGTITLTDPTELTYGANGANCYLNFADASNIGADSSGNSNDFTATNLTSDDLLLDTPTNGETSGGDIVGNYATFDPARSAYFASSNFSEGNLRLGNGNGSQNAGATGTIGVTYGQWYWEVTFNTSDQALHGVVSADAFTIGVTPDHLQGSGDSLGGADANSWGKYQATTNRRHNSVIDSYGDSYAVNDVMMVALDVDAGKIWWGKNGTWFNSGDPVAGTNAGYDNLTLDTPYFPAVSHGSGDDATYNFGQKVFAHTPPSGFKTLNTANLPDPTVDPSEHFHVTTVSHDGTSTAFTLPWSATTYDTLFVLKSTGTEKWYWLDGLNGYNKYTSSDQSTAQTTDANVLSVSGTTVTLGSTLSSATYVVYAFRAGLAGGASNTDGDITSTVSANTDSGFSIVNYTANNTANQTIGHGLTQAPEFMLNKDLGDANQWHTYHKDAGATVILYLDAADAATTNDRQWNNTAPTSSVFTVWDGDGVAWTNDGTSDHVHYCWHSSDVYNIGSYEGNASADGPFVWNGFSPDLVIVKPVDTAESWYIVDGNLSTSGGNPIDRFLYLNSTNAEFANSSGQADLVSGGMKVRGASSTINPSSTNVTFAATSTPGGFKNARGR